MNAIALANESAMDELEERTLTPPAAGRLAEVQVPVLIIAGELDTAKTRAGADFLAANLPEAQLELIPNAAHLPSLERPGAFNRLVLSFLEEE